MPKPTPRAVLFCCDHNSIRSPMAEGLMKKIYGRSTYVQSAGVRHDMEIDGYAVAVCNEIGVELCRHRTRTFQEMHEWGDALCSFDLVVALSPASRQMAQELGRLAYLDVEYWPIMDPAGQAEGREAALTLYRATRDQIRDKMIERFGTPAEG